MALFSRRGKPEKSRDPAPDDEVEQADTEALADAEQVPYVGISVSTFGAPPPQRAPSPPPRPAAVAPPATQSVPGVVDNVVLKAALAALPEKPQSTDVMNVMRQTLQGQLYVRAQGDAQALLAAGQPLNLAIATREDKRFLLAFTGGAALQQSARAEAAAATSAIGQPAASVLRGAVAGGYDGVYLDHASSGARLILPVPLIDKALKEGEPGLVLKALLAGARSDQTASQIVEALTRVPVWVAGGTDAEGRMGLAQAQTPDGRRRLEVFSHPLEVLALGRGDRPLPLRPEQLAKAIASEAALTGVVVDPGGPWFELDRDALAQLLALAD
ncbi:SseB family protein [Microbacterium sp.]|uniref:SseB family protein n=1 Tax=Microbacterium sp. TaxID=51671 RepID=UPI003C730954